MIFASDTAVPLRFALEKMANQSNKRLLFENDLSGSVSYSLNGVFWREALELLLKVNQLAKEETDKSIFFYKKTQTPISFSKTNQNLVKTSKDLPDVEAKLQDRVKISGISGSENNFLAIVNYNGHNQIWSQGKLIDGKYKVIRIENTGLTLKNEQDGEEQQFNF